MSKSEKRRKQREKKRLQRFQKQCKSQTPPWFLDWIRELPTEDQVRELDVARVNLAKIHGLRIVV